MAAKLRQKEGLPVPQQERADSTFHNKKTKWEQQRYPEHGHFQQRGLQQQVARQEQGEPEWVLLT